MAQQAGPPGVVNPALPTGQTTGSPWESNMVHRLGIAGPEDQALMMRMFQRQAQAGQGPQYQGAGGTATAPSPFGGGGMYTRQLASAMGGLPTDASGKPPGNQAARQGGYQASQKTALDQIWRGNPVKLEQPKWMGRG